LIELTGVMLEGEVEPHIAMRLVEVIDDEIDDSEEILDEMRLLIEVDDDEHIGDCLEIDVNE
jgi:hypothetical protein